MAELGPMITLLFVSCSLRCVSWSINQCGVLVREKACMRTEHGSEFSLTLLTLLTLMTLSTLMTLTRYSIEDDNKSSRSQGV